MPGPILLTSADRAQHDAGGFVAIDRPLVDAAQVREVEQLLRPLSDRYASLSSTMCTDLGIGDGEHPALAEFRRRRRVAGAAGIR